MREANANVRSAAKWRKAAERKTVGSKEVCQLCEGRKAVLTKGVFDLLHAGHLHLISQCAELKEELGANGCLVVGVATDIVVQRRKGPQRPINAENLRAEQIASLKDVDYVVLSDDIASLIGCLRPKIYVKGMDTIGGGVEPGSLSTTIPLDERNSDVVAAFEVGADVYVFIDDGELSTTELLRKISSRCGDSP